MFELRWVIRSEPAPELGNNISRNVKVLQYRTLAHIDTVSDFSDVPEFQGLEGMVWTKWKDVPIQMEEIDE